MFTGRAAEIPINRALRTSKGFENGRTLQINKCKTAVVCFLICLSDISFYITVVLSKSTLLNLSLLLMTKSFKIDVMT